MRKQKKQRRRNKHKDLWWLYLAGSVMLISVCALFVLEHIVLKDITPIEAGTFDSDSSFQNARDVDRMPAKLHLLTEDAQHNEAELDGVDFSKTAVDTTAELQNQYVVQTAEPIEIENTSVAEVEIKEQTNQHDLEYVRVEQDSRLNHALAASVNNSAWIEDGIVHILGDNQYNQCNTEMWPRIQMVRLGNAHVVGLTEEGTLVFAGSNAQRQQNLNIKGQKVVDIEASSFASYAVLEDGTVCISGMACVSNADVMHISNAVDIAADDTHLVVLKADGTLEAFGDDENGACDVDTWQDIIMIDCGYGYTMALDKNGCVFITGNCSYGQDALRGLNNIISIAAGSNTCFAIDAQGVLHAAGSNSKGQIDVAHWRNIVSVAAGYRHTIALDSEGRQLGVGDNAYGQLGNDR